jgi:hypothetical protein
MPDPQLELLFLIDNALKHWFGAGFQPEWVKSLSCDNDNKDGEIIVVCQDGTELVVRSNDFHVETPMFSVVEYSSFFAVRHNPSGDEHPMSDGVDCVFDENEEAISPGTDGFCEKWAELLNECPDTLEAYFPQHMEYQPPKP